jgi:hypothetical protein
MHLYMDKFIETFLFIYFIVYTIMILITIVVGGKLPIDNKSVVYYTLYILSIYVSFFN